MLNVKELPERFRQEMQAILGEEYQEYLAVFDKPVNRGVRVNTLRWTPEECRRKLPCEVEPVPWIPNGFFYEEETRLSKIPYYYGGLYYLQEPSAMVPASVLPVKPGDMILDLCAAPGGKSTELGARLKGKGMLIANDVSNSRAKALLKNLELFGIMNSCVTSESPEKLAKVFPEFFDGILVDAPCSGEGMFRKNPDMRKDWMEKGPEYYSKIQKEIVKEAVNMLKEGGYLLYSTCTFSRMEDEEVVQWILLSFPEMELVPLELFEGASHGIGLTGCMRLFPHKIQGEGHFLALLRKNGKAEKEAYENTKKSSDSRRKKYYNSENFGRTALERADDFWDFLKETKLEWEKSRIVEKQDMVYYLPEGFKMGNGLRYLRTGLWMGKLKKGRFEPSQAMAMVLRENTYANSISFDSQDIRVIRYLKGETITLKENERTAKGWCLVCVEGFALGFAKANGMILKNKYYPGWRWQ